MFLAFLKKQGASDRTLKAYLSDLHAFFVHMNLDLANLDTAALEAIRTEDIESFIGDLGSRNLRLSTIKRRVAAVRTYFRFLFDQGLIANNPARVVTVRPIREDGLSSQQISSIFTYLSQHQQSYDEWESLRYRRDELILLLMIFYGVHQYQIPGLKLSAIQHSGKRLALRIGRNETSTLDGFVLQKLRAYLAGRNSNADPLFLEVAKRKPIGYGSLRAIFTELNSALGLKCTPKLLHTTFQSLQQNPEERKKLLHSIATKGPSNAT